MARKSPPRVSPRAACSSSQASEQAFGQAVAHHLWPTLLGASDKFSKLLGPSVSSFIKWK